jgi:hypothetical protein
MFIQDIIRLCDCQSFYHDSKDFEVKTPNTEYVFYSLKKPDYKIVNQAF